MNPSQIIDNVLEFLVKNDTKLKRGSSFFYNKNTPCCLRGTLLKMMGYETFDLIPYDTKYFYDNSIENYFGTEKKFIKGLEYGFEGRDSSWGIPDIVGYETGAQIFNLARQKNLLIN